MSFTCTLSGDNVTVTLTDLAAFTLEKEMYTPYSALTLTAWTAVTMEDCAAIYCVTFAYDDTVLHQGTVQQLTVQRCHGVQKVTVTSRGYTALLLQNQLEPGLHSGISLDDLMTSFYTFPDAITWEANDDTSNYIYVKSSASLWDGVVGLCFKLYGNYPFVRDANTVRLTLPESYTTYTPPDDDALLKRGMVHDQSLLYSDYYMADAEGTYGAFHENEPEATARQLVRTKQLSLDQQYLYDPQEALVFRRKFADRRLKRLFLEVPSFAQVTLGDHMVYSDDLPDLVITRIVLTGDTAGIRTRLESYQDGFYGIT